MASPLTWTPGPWTLPLRRVTAAYLILSGGAEALTPILFREPLHAALAAQMAAANASGASPLDAADLRRTEDLAFGVTLVLGALFGLLLAGVGVSALGRWRWVFYACLALTGLSVVGLINSLTRPDAAALSAPLPALSLGGQVAGSALFAVLLAVRIRTGPWGMTRGA